MYSISFFFILAILFVGKMYMKKIFMVISIFIFLFSRSYPNGDLVQSLFDKSINYYDSGNVDSALDIYEKLIDSGVNSGLIYYNIGNIYMDKQQYAKSILYYEKSLRLLPHDKPLLQNIALAYKKTGNDDIYKKANVKYFHVFKNIATISMFIILISSMTFFVGIVLSIFKINFLKKNTFILLLLIFVLSCALHFYFKSVIYQDYIIVQNEMAYVRDGKTENAKNVYRLKSGEKLLVKEKHENWYYIEFPFGNYGWVRSSDVETIL